MAVVRDQDRLSEEGLDVLDGWAKNLHCDNCDPGDLVNIAKLVRMATAEIRERRAVDRGLVNTRQRNVRTYGARRRR